SHPMMPTLRSGAGCTAERADPAAPAISAQTAIKKRRFMASPPAVLAVSEAKSDVPLNRSRRLIAVDCPEARLIRPDAVGQQVARGVERKIQRRARIGRTAQLEGRVPACDAGR